MTPVAEVNPAATSSNVPDPVNSGAVILKHRRRYCRVEGCERIVKSQGLCQRHGAKPKTCKVPGCTKQAQGNFDKMCKAHFKAMKRQTTPIPKVVKNQVPPKPTGSSVYDLVLPRSISFSPARGRVMPLIAHLKHGFDTLKPPAWHRNEERAARGIIQIDNPAQQLEGWERELVWMEILVLTGVPGASFRHLARAWGRDKGFHMVLAQFICQRHGDVERKKRQAGSTINSDDNKKQAAQVAKRRRLMKMPVTSKDVRDIGADIWDSCQYGDADTNEALAAEIFDFSEKEFHRVTSKYKDMSSSTGSDAGSTGSLTIPAQASNLAKRAAMNAILGDQNDVSQLNLPEVAVTLAGMNQIPTHGLTNSLISQGHQQQQNPLIQAMVPAVHMVQNVATSAKAQTNVEATTAHGLQQSHQEVAQSLQIHAAPTTPNVQTMQKIADIDQAHLPTPLFQMKLEDQHVPVVPLQPQQHQPQGQHIASTVHQSAISATQCSISHQQQHAQQPLSGGQLHQEGVQPPIQSQYASPQDQQQVQYHSGVQQSLQPVQQTVSHQQISMAKSQVEVQDQNMPQSSSQLQYAVIMQPQQQLVSAPVPQQHVQAIPQEHIAGASQQQQQYPQQQEQQEVSYQHYVATPGQQNQHQVELQQLQQVSQQFISPPQQQQQQHVGHQDVSAQYQQQPPQQQQQYTGSPQLQSQQVQQQHVAHPQSNQPQLQQQATQQQYSLPQQQQSQNLQQVSQQQVVAPLQSHQAHQQAAHDQYLAPSQQHQQAGSGIHQLHQQQQHVEVLQQNQLDQQQQALQHQPQLQQAQQQVQPSSHQQYTSVVQQQGQPPHQMTQDQNSVWSHDHSVSQPGFNATPQHPAQPQEQNGVWHQEQPLSQPLQQQQQASQHVYAQQPSQEAQHQSQQSFEQMQASKVQFQMVVVQNQQQEQVQQVSQFSVQVTEPPQHMQHLVSNPVQLQQPQQHFVSRHNAESSRHHRRQHSQPAYFHQQVTTNNHAHNHRRQMSQPAYLHDLALERPTILPELLFARHNPQTGAFGTQPQVLQPQVHQNTVVENSPHLQAQHGYQPEAPQEHQTDSSQQTQQAQHTHIGGMHSSESFHQTQLTHEVTYHQQQPPPHHQAQEDLIQDPLDVHHEMHVAEASSNQSSNHYQEASQ